MCRFSPDPQGGVVMHDKAWFTKAVVAANNIIACVADINEARTPVFGFHLITVMSKYMRRREIDLPYESGTWFLFYKAPQFDGQPTHGQYSTRIPTDAHQRPQQADSGVLTFRGEFPNVYTGFGLPNWGCRVDNGDVEDALSQEDTDGDGVIDEVKCPFRPHQHGEVAVHISLNRLQWRGGMSTRAREAPHS